MTDSSWTYFYVRRHKFTNEPIATTYTPESPADYERRYRGRTMGAGIVVEWYDDALFMWTEIGVYANLDEYLEQRHGNS